MAANTTNCSIPSLTTFKVSDVKVECVKPSKKSTISSICSQLKPYVKNHCSDVLMETKFSSRVRVSIRNNGFVNTVIECYNNHHNLIIRPDDIWTAIMTQFSFYINANAEEFRSQFVDFEGKKELTVTFDGTLRNTPYEKLVDRAVKDWSLSNFTTTSPNDIVSCGIVLMAMTKKYFNFTCCLGGEGSRTSELNGIKLELNGERNPSLGCGIPYFTLAGSVDDWENILNKLEKLKSYKLDKWYDMLQPILKEFVAAKKNEPNIDFWNRICHYIPAGSGSTFISGWLTAFAVFDEDGMMQGGNDGQWPAIDIAKIASGIVTADVKIVDSSTEYESLMFAGYVAYEVLEDDSTLKPRIGWGMALKLSTEESP